MKRIAGGIAAWILLIGGMTTLIWQLATQDVEIVAELERTYSRKLALLQRLEELPKREEDIRRQLSDLGNEQAGKYLYEGDRQSTQVVIQRDIRQLASQAQMTIGSMRALNRARTNGRLEPMTVQVNSSANYQTLVRFFETLEQAQPMLKIRKMSIHVQTASTQTRPAMLRVVMEVSGFRDQSVRERIS